MVHNSKLRWLDIVVSIGIGFRDIENPGNDPGQGVTAVMGRVRDIVEGGRSYNKGQSSAKQSCKWWIGKLI